MARIKKSLIVFFVSALVLLISSVPILGAVPPIQLQVNGAMVEADADPYLYQDYTMVPIRFATGPLNAVLFWDEKISTATLVKERITIEMSIGSQKIKVNGVDYELSVPVQKRNDRTYIPVRAISELFGATVHWVQETSTVQIAFPEDNNFDVIGYYYDAASLTMAHDYIEDFTKVIHFNYELKEDGHVNERTHYVPDRYEECDPLLRVNGKDNMFLVTGFSRDTLNKVLSSAVLRKQAIDDICAILKNEGYNGVNLDFESMPAEQRENYVTFVKELKQAMPSGKLLSLSLQPRENERQTWLDGYDYAGLAAAADQLIFMFYDQHYSGSLPGPVAGADWMERNIIYLLQYVPPEKMLAGLGCYGYGWPDDGGRGASTRIATAFDVAQRYGVTIEREESSGVPHYTYVNDEGQRRQVWFEDAQSLAQKAELAVKYRLKGIAIWRMGFFPNEVFDAILEAVK